MIVVNHSPSLHARQRTVSPFPFAKTIYQRRGSQRGIALRLPPRSIELHLRILTLAGALVFFSNYPLEASESVDQSFTNPPYSSEAVTSLAGDTLFAQSFTAGGAGQLTGADILAFDGTSSFGANHPPVGDLTVQIRGFADGAPTPDVLASFTVASSNLVANPNGQFTHVNFTPGVAVAPGQVLSLVISGAGVGCYLQLGSAAAYGGGQAYVKSHAGNPWGPFPDPGGRAADFFFRTYVSGPETASARVVSLRITNGVFHVRFSGTANHSFVIDRAGTSAGPWQMGFTNLSSDAAGNFELLDPIGRTAASGFYRVR